MLFPNGVIGIGLNALLEFLNISSLYFFTQPLTDKPRESIFAITLLINLESKLQNNLTAKRQTFVNDLLNLFILYSKFDIPDSSLHMGHTTPLKAVFRG